MHEIETINGHRGELDDQELTALEEQAEGETVLQSLSDALPAQEGVVAAAKLELDTVHAAVDAQVADLRQQRAAVVEGLGQESSALYERVRKQFGGVGVARLEGSHCSGCHMDLSPRELDIVKAVPADTLAECPQCGRIIVR